MLQLSQLPQLLVLPRPSSKYHCIPANLVLTYLLPRLESSAPTYVEDCDDFLQIDSSLVPVSITKVEMAPAGTGGCGCPLALKSDKASDKVKEEADKAKKLKEEVKEKELEAKKEKLAKEKADAERRLAEEKEKTEKAQTAKKKTEEEAEKKKQETEASTKAAADKVANEKAAAA